MFCRSLYRFIPNISAEVLLSDMCLSALEPLVAARQRRLEHQLLDDIEIASLASWQGTRQKLDTGSRPDLVLETLEVSSSMLKSDYLDGLTGLTKSTNQLLEQWIACCSFVERKRIKEYSNIWPALLSFLSWAYTCV
jgi:hypothetical protein